MPQKYDSQNFKAELERLTSAFHKNLSHFTFSTDDQFDGVTVLF